jgi:hypothetical protein
MNSKDYTLNREALKLEVQALMDEMRQQRLARFESRPLAWLALVPAWTYRLAQLCGFPTGGLPLNDFFQQVASSGLCTRSTDSIWMPDSTRAEVLEDLRQQKNVDFLQESSEIGQRILKVAHDNKNLVSPLVFRWAELAVQTKPGLREAGRWLDNQIQNLIKKDDTGEALAWVRTGTDLAQVLRGELELQVALGNNRVEREYRRRQDERHLQHFLPRQEQIENFHKLLEGSDEIWALHYIGIGGVGKTMLMRYITARLAPECNALTSRVDFDHISPDYPVYTPGQLLVELADQLRPFFSTHIHNEYFEKVQNSVTELQEVLSAEPPPGHPLANLERPEFAKVLRVFTALLKSLPQPVILILDTCEELAKLQPVGSIAPSVAATFKILEAVHDAVPTIRVIFSGRRPLAKSGYGWHLSNSSLSVATNSQLADKPYLRLHEIRGFDQNEAQDFFSNIKKVNLSPEMRDAILKRSRNTSVPADIIWEPPRLKDKAIRYNPFDLALYADWVLEDASVTVETIATGETDPYIERRIINRIKPEVQVALPAVILLRRFDETILRLALDVSDADFNKIFQELSNQEWIDYQPDQALQTAFLDVDQNLYPRLLQYYQHPCRQQLLKNAAQKLAPRVQELVQQRPLNQLSIDFVEAALRLIGTEQGVVKVASFWEEIARRISTEMQWSWAKIMSERLLSETGTVSKEYPNLYASVKAVYIAALIRELPNSIAIPSYWDEVAQTAAAHPDSRISYWLRQRALSGHISASIRLSKKLPNNDKIQALWEILAEYSQQVTELGQPYAEQLAASLCAAVEALLDFCESERNTNLLPRPELLSEWARSLEKHQIAREILAFAWTLAGWSLALHKQWDEARLRFEQAVTVLPTNTGPQCWFDWRMPDCLRDRIRLEMLRLLPMWLNFITSDRLNEWQQQAIRHLRQIDSERLTSLILKLRLNQEPIPEEDLKELTSLEYYNPDPQLACIAHHTVPPLFVTLALGWLALGKGDLALAQLNERLTEASETRRDPLSVRIAERTKMQVIRRQRLDKQGLKLMSRLSSSQNPEDVAAAWPLIAIINSQLIPSIPQPNDKSPPATVHAWWSSQCTLKQELDRASLNQRSRLIQNAIQDAFQLDAELERLALELDLQEAILVAEEYDVLLGLQALTFQPEPYNSFSAHELEKLLRLILRASVLIDRYTQEDISWAEQVGWRWMAEIALSEGELLALRLPSQAVCLLDLAYHWFLAANDPVGATIAAIRSAIATIQAGIIDTAREKLQEIVCRSYQRLTATTLASDLPQWSDLIVLSNELIPQQLSELNNHPSWGGWLTRLFYSLVWLTDPQGRSKQAVKARSWLMKLYGSSVPIELAVLPSEKSVPSKTERLMLWRGVSLSITLPPNHSSPNLIREPDLVIPVLIHLNVPKSALYQDHSAVEVVEQSQTIGLRPYHVASTDIPQEIINHLIELQTLQGDRKLPVPLEVQPSLASCAWEAVLALALPLSEGNALQERFQFWRFGETLPHSSAKSGWRTGWIHMLSSQTWWSLTLEQVWLPLTSQIAISHDVSQLNVRLRERGQTVKVLHLIGTSVITSAGVQLQLTQETSSQGILVRADSLPLHLPSLVVVQAEPADLPRRQETEREQATCMRAYAAEVFAAGARAVIMLPTLPLELTEVVLNLLAENLSPTKAPDLWQLLNAANIVQKAVAEWRIPASLITTDVLETTDAEIETTFADTMLELALDICLFARLDQSDAEALSLCERQLNLETSLLPEEIYRLKQSIQKASSQIKRQIFMRSREVRSENWRHNKLLMERTIPIFKALIASDTTEKFHNNYGQLGYALKDKLQPCREDWVNAEAAFTKAINIRNKWHESGFHWYEFNRAICRIVLDEAFSQKQPSSPQVRAAILNDLQTANQDQLLAKLILKNDDPDIFNPIPDWLRLNLPAWSGLQK